jgi:ComF family protein
MTFLRLLTLLARGFLTFLAGALSPPACAACDAPVPSRHVFCSTCARTVVRAGVGEAKVAVAFAVFGGAIALALRRFKYEERPDLGRPLGHLLRMVVRESGIAADIVVPVPLHPRRLVERGYNQAALLAREAASELGVPLGARVLWRVKHTAQQARLGREERIVNMKEAFGVRDARVVRGKRVLIVDDVATTGSTLLACREALIEAGAAEVIALVVARAEGGDRRKADGAP